MNPQGGAAVEEGLGGKTEKTRDERGAPFWQHQSVKTEGLIFILQQFDYGERKIHLHF